MMKFLNTILILLFLTLSFVLNAGVKNNKCESDKNPICQSIIKLNPRLDKKVAMKYSNIFSKMGKKYKINPYLIVSIAFQESTFKNKTVRTVKGYIKEEGVLKKVKVGLDYCMMQINANNIEKFEIDADKLVIDPAYCIENGVKLLSSMKKDQSDKDVFWWTLYNANSKHHRLLYQGLVMRHLEKISKEPKLKINNPEENNRVIAQTEKP